MRSVLLLLIVCAPLVAGAAENTSLNAEATDKGEHVSLRLHEPAQPHVFLVDNPPRVVIDMPTSQWRDKVALAGDYSGTLIKKLRFGVYNAKTTRLVLDLSATVALREVHLVRGWQRGSYDLEFDLVGHGVERTRAATSEPRSFGRRSTGEKPVIVIDAGHGGQDPGTSGRDGTQEKDLTLDYARALQQALEDTGQFHAVLTRSEDHYYLLRDRVKRARAAKGDLFISLHADSAPTPQAHGLSVYTISEKASDKESEQLAAEENKADVIGGMDLSSASEDVASILIDLTQRETRAKSARFADMAVKNLGREVKLLSNTHRFAGFAVLKAPDIPSVLVEIGFLTSPREERLLKSSGYQSKVIHGLVKAIDSYFGKHNK